MSVRIAKSAGFCFGVSRAVELVEQAALKETSLFTLANRCGITPPETFVERFIEYDREVRDHGSQHGA